jgi:hypothetical protein
MSTMKPSRKKLLKKEESRKKNDNYAYAKPGKSVRLDEDINQQESENEDDAEDEDHNEVPSREVNLEKTKQTGKESRDKPSKTKDAPTKTLKKRPASAQRQ